MDLSTLGHVAFTLYNAFKTGAEQIDWKMKMIVKTVDQIFHGCPVRREDYFTITGSNQFPSSFCGTRLVIFFHDLFIYSTKILCIRN